MFRVARSFAFGNISIDQAYTNQTAWPGRMPWGAIYPGAREAIKHLPKGQRLRSLNVHSYCMLPDCEIETYMSYKLGVDYVKVMYGSPEEAKQAFKDSGLNFFLISSEQAIQEPLAVSPLFRADSIFKNMGVVWTDGTTALLTWMDAPDTSTLHDSWLAAYRTKVAESKINIKALFALIIGVSCPKQPEPSQ